MAEQSTPKPKWIPGGMKGTVWIKADDTFDDSLEDLEQAIEESEIEILLDTRILRN